MPTIIIVEPHTLYRLGIVHLLTKALAGFKLIDMDYTSLENATEQHQCDLLLLSVPSAEASPILLNTAKRMLQPDAVLLITETTRALPSPHELPEVVMGHLLKNASSELMIASVNLVLAGGTCLTYPATQTQQAEVSEEKGLCISSEAEAQLLGITPRQYEVLVLLTRGLSIKEVARELHISAATVKAHAETLYMRMNVSNRNEAVYQAVAKGARLGIPTTWVA